MSRNTIPDTLKMWFVGLRKELERSAKSFKLDLSVENINWSGMSFTSEDEDYSLSWEMTDHELILPKGEKRTGFLVNP